jgi:hypothetical protein
MLIMSEYTEYVTDEQLKLLIERDNPTSEIARMILDKRRASTNSQFAHQDHGGVGERVNRRTVAGD